MLRIVLDTNVLVSATIAKGKPRDLLELAIQKRFVLLKSDETVEEFVGVLEGPKFKMTKKEIIRAKNTLARTGQIIAVTSKRKVVKEDPDDDIFINAALDGNADFIVSGDPHLLTLSNYKGVEIVTVDEMLKKFGY